MTAVSNRMLMKRFQLLCSRTGISYFSSSSESEQDQQKPEEKRPRKSLFGIVDLRERELDHNFPDPVRNTEREYYETHLNPEWEGHQRSIFESRFFTKKHGISQDVMSWLHWDININDNLYIDDLLQKRFYSRLKHDQRYRRERTMAVGEELGAAHFVVSRGGRVKFTDRDVWFGKDERGQHGLPRVMIEGLSLEAIDATNTDFTYVAFDNFSGLSKLRFMRFQNCPYVDDWCLGRLHRLRHSLEYLDITDCPEITDNGLMSLQCLHKLKVLRLSKLPKAKHMGLVGLLLEEHLPKLNVLGLSESDIKPPEWDHRGESRLVRALLGLAEKNVPEEEGLYVKEIGKTSREELKRYVRSADS